MKTLDLFSKCDIRSKSIARGTTWLAKHRDMVASWADDLRIDKAAVIAAIDEDLATAGIPAVAAQTGIGDLTIIIPCHNYGCFLQECLDSIAASVLHPTCVIVVDDASYVPVAASDFNLSHLPFQIEWLHVDFRSQAQTCRHGFQHVDTKYVLWLDADDKLHPDYLSTAVAMLEADREAAIAFPLLEAFGDRTGSYHGVERAPDLIRWHDLESRNWCAASSVYRADIVRQSLAVQTERVAGCGCNDWITARTVLRAGPWHALKCNVPLFYRQHQGQTHTNEDFPKYHLQANLENEIITIIVPFSGRWPQWQKLRDWITTQDWPRAQTRLMVLNSTHGTLTAEQLGLQEWNGLGFQIERIDVGFPKLADEERRGRADIQRYVDSAVAGLYNRAFEMAYGEWMLICEDDVIPQRPDAIRKLMQSIGPRVAAVSGVYKHRYDDEAVAFAAPVGKLAMKCMQGPEIEHVTGTGFGCLLARRSVFSSFGLSGDDKRCWFFDVNLGVRIARAGWQWILDRSVYCDHLV